MELVGRDAHPQAGPADQDAPVGLAVADLMRDRCGDVGIVHRLVAKRAHVLDLMAKSLDQLDHLQSDRIPTMVSPNGYTHVLPMRESGPVVREPKMPPLLRHPLYILGSQFQLVQPGLQFRSDPGGTRR